MTPEKQEGYIPEYECQELAAPLPDPKKYSECAIRLCNSELIGKQLLVALSDESKVACIFDKEDLREVLCALGLASGSHNKKCLEHDLRQLFVSAFGEQPY